MVYLVLHCTLFPFKYQRLNILEVFCLFSLIIISSATTRINEGNEEFTEVFVGFAILIPFAVIACYILKACLFLYLSKRRKYVYSESELKRITKIKDRAPVAMSDTKMDMEGNGTGVQKEVSNEINVETNPYEIEMQATHKSKPWDNIDRRETISRFSLTTDAPMDVKGNETGVETNPDA